VNVVLSEHLPLLATAPDGIKKLRGLILELAVRGKLVPQDPDDEPASELLKRIASKKSGQKSKLMASLDSDERPFEVPDSWQWTRFESVFSLEYGDNLPAPKRTNSGEFPVYGSNGVVGSHSECSVRNSCIVVGRKGSAGALNLCLSAGCWVTDVAYYCIPPKEFDLLFCFKMFHTLGLAELGKGIKPGLSRSEAYVVPVAVPPLAEQQRIVAKVDELMALCDRLEAEQADSDTAHARLVETLLGMLTQSADADELGANWQLLVGHFDTLFSTEASLNALKQAILQLAVMGKLVPQSLSDEPATELLKKIELERGRLAKTVGKKSRPLPTIAYEDGPFDIPDGWVWTNVESIADVGTGTTPSRTNPAYFNPALIPWATSGETREFYIGATNEKVSPLALKETNLTLYPVGTLIVAMYGQGKTRGQISELEIEATTNQACAAIAPVLPAIEARRYIKLFFRKIYDEIREEAAGGAQPNLNVGKIKATLISLPPLAEQHRIVAKVDELMALCDRLESDLVESRSRQARLADTLITAALEAA